MKNTSLKTVHIIIAALSVIGILIVSLVDGWGKMVFVFPALASAFCSGNLEKKDEMAKDDLSKANSVTMWFMFIVLAFFGMASRFHYIHSSAFVIAICMAFAVRSIMFIIFDSAFGSKEISKWRNLLQK